MCVAGTPPTFTCSGANTTQQTITFDDATVGTVPGFSVVTADPRAAAQYHSATVPSPTPTLNADLAQ